MSSKAVEELRKMVKCATFVDPPDAVFAAIRAAVEVCREYRDAQRIGGTDTGVIWRREAAESCATLIESALEPEGGDDGV